MTPLTTVDTALQYRRDAFGGLVKHAVASHQAQRRRAGLRPSQRVFADRIGISLATLDRWLHGRWTQDPSPNNVDSFIRVAGIHPGRVYTALGWDDRPPPVPQHPDMARIQQRLADPSVSNRYKQHVYTVLADLLRHDPYTWDDPNR